MKKSIIVVVCLLVCILGCGNGQSPNSVQTSDLSGGWLVQGGSGGEGFSVEMMLVGTPCSLTTSSEGVFDVTGPDCYGTAGPGGYVTTASGSYLAPPQAALIGISGTNAQQPVEVLLEEVDANGNDYIFGGQGSYTQNSITGTFIGPFGPGCSFTQQQCEFVGTFVASRVSGPGGSGYCTNCPAGDRGPLVSDDKHKGGK
jgi:hypothetical protein